MQVRNEAHPLPLSGPSFACDDLFSDSRRPGEIRGEMLTVALCASDRSLSVSFKLGHQSKTLLCLALETVPSGCSNLKLS